MPAAPRRGRPGTDYLSPNRTLLSLNAFPMTDTDDSDMAAAAKMGLSSRPKAG